MTTLDHFVDLMNTDLGHPFARTPRIVFLAFSIWGSAESFVKKIMRFRAGVHSAEFALMLNCEQVRLTSLVTTWMGASVPLAGFSSLWNLIM